MDGSGRDVEFRLLGPVELWAAGRPVDCGQPRQRAVLAALLVDAGRLVTWDALISRIWDQAAPNGVRGALYSHVARVRQTLARVGDEVPVRLERRTGGYLLDVDPDRVDLHRFRRLVDDAGSPAAADADRVGSLRQALQLWRGEPLAGLKGEWFARLREGCHRERVAAALAWARAETSLGNPGVVIEPLTALLDEHPLVEPLAAALMRALHATDHTARALDCYTTMRRRLVDELGADPGAELQRVHREILRGDVDRSAAVRIPKPSADAWDVSAQLPMPVPGFVGRHAELAQLDAISGGSGPPVRVVALLGTAGVGKTALAVHWGHQVMTEFPDGQLYVNLRGFDPAGPAMSAAEALRGFLEALSVPPQRMPATVEALAGLYRTVLARRRVLIVLDNARDAEQVRPLLPGAPGCFVVVTSRDLLFGLVSAEGAHPITLDLLSRSEARQLMTARLGPARIIAEPTAVDQIVTSCARLPLALAIVSARAATHPWFALGSLAEEIVQAAGLLDRFAGSDAVTNVRAVFSWSYQTLGPDAARLFRLLGIHPGPDLTAPAAASLAAMPVHRAVLLLAELATAHLVTEPVPGRFALHDLLRAYAGELAHHHDGDDDRRAALHRTYDHYLHTAYLADRLLHPSREPITPAPPQPGVVPLEPGDENGALAWFTTEHAVLLAAIHQAARNGFDSHTWQLAWSVETFLNRRGHWHDWATTQHAALQAAQCGASQDGQIHAHRGLAGAYIWLNRYDDAENHLTHALDLLRERSDRTGQASTHLDFAWMLERQHRHDELLSHAMQALDLYQAVGHKAGQARALNSVGWAHALLGDFRQSLSNCQQALALYPDIGDPSGEAHTWDSLGYAHHRLGHHRESTACYRRAIDLFHDLGDQYNKADTLHRLGDAHHGAADLDSARLTWQRAVNILEELGHPDAQHIRAKLADDRLAHADA